MVPTKPLAWLLLRASQQLDHQLRERLVRTGWPSLSPAQSLLFAHLPAAGVSPAGLARALGVSRQAVHQLVGGLVQMGLLAVAVDPARRRGRLVVVTASGRALTREAAAVLADLEDDYGRGRAQVLRELLQDLI